MMPDIKFLSIDYPLTPSRHSRIIARIKGSYFIMKKTLLWVGGIVSILFIWFLVEMSSAVNYRYVISNPFKVTDPNDPDFDPLKFSFNAYKSHTELAEALSVVFPVGTPRKEVEKILIDIGNATYIKTSINEIRRLNSLPGAEGMGWGHGYRYRDAFDNFDPAYKITYSHPSSIKKFTWKIIAYYDSQDHLMLMFAHTEIVHPEVLNI